MVGQSVLPYAYIQQYGVTALMVAAAVPLWAMGGPVCGLIALFVASVSLLSANRLMRQVRRADDQKIHLDRQLMQAQKLASIGELSSGIAHEINNPLAVIGQEVEWMRHILKGEEISRGEGLEELGGCPRTPVSWHLVSSRI